MKDKSSRSPVGSIPVDAVNAAHMRLEALFDAGAFDEFDAAVVHRTDGFGMSRKRVPGDGVVTGVGKISGRTVFAYSQDRNALAGSVGEAHARKICKMMDLAVRTGSPVVGICDSGGARIQEGIDCLAGYGEIFHRNVKCSGVIPQISLLLGAGAGGVVYSTALADFVIACRGQSRMFLAGSKAVKPVTYDEISFEDGSSIYANAEQVGMAHFTASHDVEAIGMARRLLSYLPENCQKEPPTADCQDPPDRLCQGIKELVPGDTQKAYDVKEVITRVIDKASFLEVHAAFAPNVVVGLGRLGGRVVGVVANQPAVLGGVLDTHSCRKAARFIRTCNAFRIPVLTFVDVPGIMPGKDMEGGSVVTHGAKLLYAYSEATVPKLTVVLRRAFGGAYIAMGSKHVGADVNLAWPTAEIAVMGAAGAVEVLYRKEIAAAQDPVGEQRRRQGEYHAHFLSPRQAAERGFVDEIIDPENTRWKLCRLLNACQHKQELSWPRRNGNIPT